MPSKRDELQAHQFLFQRAVSALVMRETDPVQPPFRRPGAAAIAGIALAVVSLGATAVYGLVSPGGDRSWQDGKSVILEKETGTRYVYVGGRLDPVADYASALLAIADGNSSPGTVSVSRNSLLGVPRGPRIGIPDAPDALPGPDQALSGGWSLCSDPEPDVTGVTVERSTLLVGTPPGGTPLGEGALLVQVAGSGEEYLVQHGYRHPVAAEDSASVGVALGAAPLTRIAPAAVDVLPAGAPIAPVPVPDAGKPSQAVPGRAVVTGQVFDLGARHYLAEPDRLRPISDLQARIQLAYHPTVAAYPGGRPASLPLTPMDAGSAKLAPDPIPDADAAPSSPPVFADPGVADTPVCLGFAPDSFLPDVFVASPLPPAPAMAATPGRGPGGVALADRVLVPPGRVAVVEAMPAPDAPAGTLAVVTDLGRAYPLGSPEVLGALGYGGVRPVRVPASLVARVPQGPGLDHDDAMKQW